MVLGPGLKQYYALNGTILANTTSCLALVARTATSQSTACLSRTNRALHSTSAPRAVIHGSIVPSQQKMTMAKTSRGDLNNESAMRATEPPRRDPAFAYRSLAITPDEDDPDIREKYRPFLLAEDVQTTDWVSQLELATAAKMAHEDYQRTGSRLKVLVLYGSLRKR